MHMSIEKFIFTYFLIRFVKCQHATFPCGYTHNHKNMYAASIYTKGIFDIFRNITIYFVKSRNIAKHHETKHKPKTNSNNSIRSNHDKIATSPPLIMLFCSPYEPLESLL